MTTPRPIASNADGAALPDEAVLNRLAAQFFSALPSGGSTVIPSAVAPDGPTSESSKIPAAMPAGGQPLLSSEVPAAVPPGGPTPEPTVPGWGPEVPMSVPTSVADPYVDPLLPGLPSLDAPLSPPRIAASAPAYYFLDKPTSESAKIPAAMPPGGPTPESTVPGWARQVSTSVADPYVDPLLPGLPSLDAPLSPPRIAASAPGYYFLDKPTSESAKIPAAIPAGAHPPFDVHAVRNDFPILREQVNGHPLVWFDNAATTQKPRAVIERLRYFYEHENSNIHRAAHELAARSTDAYEQAREIVARFLGASSAEEIIYVRGATEGINLIAQTWGRKHIRAGDEIVISHLEHHANIVPWQLLAAETGAVLRVIPVDEHGQVLLDEYGRLLSDRTKLVAVTQVSNALGTITPVREIVAQARRAGAVTVVDGAQSVPHMRIDVRSLDTDFFVFSGHKLFGPTGIGVVYGKSEVLQDMPPWQGGGNMISDVTLERSLFQPPPGRFEAGTGNIADAIGLGAAIEYVEGLGLENIARYEHELLAYATPRLAAIPGVRLVGTARDKASVLSFTLTGHEPLEVGKALNQKGIAVRAGHHCAQPILRRFGVEATVRPSFAFYNTCAEIDRMLTVVENLARARR
ncbi:SufS family cysteine desulfurase [Nocardia sp. CDC159]|uniref:Cysteine desulfurase n=1 Tax=Nocardia pulmonis TaxID=2951408 RepID=A0A9X2E6B9_9NOCA|nr:MULTISPECIES: family 2A encapsulin nanocompartment cargo protein cysteine desulfurase [Nocardia]MCM6774604.1 SufS family cysteine desulfurase [Nocardia pulmonis]MCM6787331.1 SufS family cysteine desulfurase [Nocardia sp. CDC159]